MGQSHYENLPMQYTQISLAVKIEISLEKKKIKKINISNIFTQNIDCGYTLELTRRAVLTSTHNLCFGSKIGKIGLPL